MAQPGEPVGDRIGPRWFSIVRIVTSMAIVAVILGMLAGTVLVIAAVWEFSGEPVAERALVITTLFLIWGPLNVIGWWRVTLPIVVIAGPALASARTRFDLDSRIAANPIGRTIAAGVVFTGVLFAVALSPRP